MFRKLFYSLFLCIGCCVAAHSQVTQRPDTLAGCIVEEGEDEEDLELSVDPLFIDVARPSSFQFDTIFAPCFDLYKCWDTIVIDPYREGLVPLTDTLKIVLGDSDDCFFYPPCLNNITSGFGYRRWGRRYMKFHYGIDFSLKTGDQIYAAFDGVVRIAKYSDSYGYMVVIRHYNGFETLYGHFSKLLVYPGQSIRAGETIGLGGSSGHSTGSHLHLEIRFKGKPLDPSKIIAFDRKQLFSDTVNLNSDYFAHLKLHKELYNNGKRWVTYKAPKGKLYHKVRRGESIYHLAHKYHTTVGRICKLNHISKRTKLKAGRRLRVR